MTKKAEDRVVTPQFMSTLIFLTLFSYFMIFLLVHYNKEIVQSQILGMYKQKNVISGIDDEIVHTESDANITIVSVVCSNSNYDDLLVMIKSALLFQKSSRLRFVIFAPNASHNILHDEIEKIKSTKNSFIYMIRNNTLPLNGKKWSNKQAGCVSLKLFLPNLLKMNKILYVDADTIFLNDISDIWGRFKLMNSSQMIALAMDAVGKNPGFYTGPEKPKIKFYGSSGLNTGVMLMDLKKMRQSQWVDFIHKVYEENQHNLKFIAQDIVNIISHYNPRRLYILPCNYNYKPQQCMYNNTNHCEEAEVEGVKLLHRHSELFHYNKFNEEHVFNITFKCFQNYTLEYEPYEYLVKPLQDEFNDVQNTSCGSVAHIFLKNLQKSFPDPDDEPWLWPIFPNLANISLKEVLHR